MQTTAHLALALNDIDFDYPQRVYKTRLEGLLIRAAMKLCILMFALFTVATIIAIPALIVPTALFIVAGIAYSKMNKEKSSKSAI